jgi:uncharacterized protein YbjQ (UPF0145 family)
VATMRARAAAIGCDAVVITQVDTHVVKNGPTQTLAGTCVMWAR